MQIDREVWMLVFIDDANEIPCYTSERLSSSFGEIHLVISTFVRALPLSDPNLWNWG